MAATTGVGAPDRRMTDPFPEEKGDIVELLGQRLDAWKHAVSYLEEYVEETAKMHKGLSKDYEKIFKTVSDPLKNGDHFAQNTGGIASLFENVRTNTQAISNSQIETEKALKTQIANILSRLHSEVKNKQKELSGGAAKGSKAVEKSRQQTQKAIEHLGQQTSTFESVGGRIDPESDPYIIQRGVRHHLHKQLLEENNHRKDIIEVQNNFLVFERHIVETVQNCMVQFFQIVGGQTDKTKMLYSDMTTTAQNIPTEFEWNNFLTSHGDVMIDPKHPDRDITAIVFPNQDHGATKPMIEGQLQRKGKIMRSYNTGYYTVTAAGYLHEFKENNDFKESPEPELSLYLAECAIGGPPQVGDGKFNVSGKDANKNQKLTQKHEFRFKANSHDEAVKWYDIISQFCTGKLTRQSSLMTPISPASGKTAETALPPAYAETHASPAEKQVAQPQPVVDTHVTQSPTAVSPGPSSAAAPAPVSPMTPASAGKVSPGTGPSPAAASPVIGSTPASNVEFKGVHQATVHYKQ